MAIQDIYGGNALARPMSVQDYDNQNMLAQQHRQSLQQGALALQTGQQNALQAQNVLQQRQKLQDAAQSGQLDWSNPEHQNRALSMAPDVAPGLIKTINEGVTQRAVASKDASVSAENYGKLLKGAVGVIMANPTGETVDAVLGHYSQVTGQPVDKARQVFALANGDPEKIRRIAYGFGVESEKQLPKIETRNTGGSTDTLAIDPLTGKPTMTSSVKNTQSPDSIAANATHIRTTEMTQAGQDRRDSAGRSNAAEIAGLQNGKAPPGYVWGPAGADGSPTMIAVAGGPADLKKQGLLNADTQALTGSVSSLDRLGAAANEVLKHPGLKGVYGLRGVLPNIPGGQSADAAALLNTLKSQVGFGVLQDMRNNSKTGGALGAVSDRENVMLQANLAALEKAQSVEQAQNSLKKIIDYAEQAKGRMRDAYNMKHVAQPGQAPTPAAAPTAAPKKPATVSNW